MRTLHSFPLRQAPRQDMYLPHGSQMLGVKVSHGIAYLLVEKADDARPLEQWEVAVFSMNTPIPDGYGGHHVGWFCYTDSALTWHVYAQKTGGHVE